MTTTERGPSLKDRQRHERQELILRAAADLMAERGYHEMSLDEIAARVGISKGAIYLHFPSKEDLVVTLVSQGMTSFTDALHEALSGDGSPREKLEHVIERVTTNLACAPHTHLAVVMRQPELLNRLAERRESMRQAMEEPRQRLAEVIEQGKASGDFDPQLPTPLLLNVLIAMLSPHLYRGALEGDGLTREELVAGLRRFFFKGIAPGADAPDTATPGTHEMSPRRPDGPGYSHGPVTEQGDHA